MLPGPDIGKLCVEEMRSVKRAGFECGIHTGIMLFGRTTFENEVNIGPANKWLCLRTFLRSVWGTTKDLRNGAAGWQMNPEALFN